MSEWHLVTVRYELWDGDVTSASLLPMPQTGIMDVLQVIFVDGEWEVSSTDPTAHASWKGRAPSRQEAVLNYLKARLGIE